MISVFDSKLLDSLVQQANELPRRRKNLNLHQSLDDPVQKLFNAMQTDSYVRPHRHPEKEKTELIIAVRGSFVALTFDNQGSVSERIEFSANGDVLGAQITPNTWHTVVALEDGSIFFEVKQGPYTVLSDKDFANWAPAENTPPVKDFLSWLRQARPGDRSGFF